MKDIYNYDAIFHSYTKYRPSTFNNVMAYDNSIFKFKDRVNEFNKIQKEMEMEADIKSAKKHFEPVEIFIKENNKKKVYIDQSQSDHESIESNEEEKSGKQLKKTNSEPNLEISQEEKENKNLLNNEKTFLAIGGFSDITNALIKRGWSKTNEVDPKKILYSFLYTIKIADIPFEDL